MSVVIDSLTKRFGAEVAVDGVSVAIDHGEFFCILGASGCGKSTLLRLVAGLETADGGSVALSGETVTGPGIHVPPEDRKCGFVFQSYALWPHMSVLDNVAFPAEAQGHTKAEARRLALAHLETVSLTAYAERKPAALSGGQRQRVALARCLAGGATTILMDEPLANLDPHLRAVMEEELTRFHGASNVTTLYITHDQREAMAVADRVAVMEAGHFLQVGTPREIYERPANEAVARFIGRDAILVAPTGEGTANVHGHSFSVEGATTGVSRPRRLFIRPEHVALVDSSALDVLQGQVVSALYRGGHFEGTIAVDGVEAGIQVTSRTPIRSGETVGLQLEKAWVLPEN